MDEEKRKILETWLKVDFYSVANKANLIKKAVEIDDKLIYDTIHCLDYETIVNKTPDVNYVITIIGLMWEYSNREKYDLRPIIIKILSRVGYPTSAIICDDNFDKQHCSFSPLQSIIDEILITLNQKNNEVEICGHNYLLTNFQKEIWDSMDTDKLLGISAPTSAGKSFVILLKLVSRLIFEQFDVVYIVPTLSLLNQVSEDFNNVLKQFNVSNYWISNTFEEEVLPEYNYIYILTQEKAISAFSNYSNAFSKKLVLVVDEIQNIERIKEDNDERSKILFDTLTEFKYKENVEQVIISGPRIEKIDVVGKEIFGSETKSHITTVSPVLNITYSINKVNDNYYFKQYCNLTDVPNSEIIQNSSIIKGYGKKTYTPDYVDFLDSFVNDVGADCQNIIFAPTSRTARNLALKLKPNESIVNKELIQYYKDTVHENYSLCNSLEKGVAYHHGKQPMHVRKTLEKAISERMINNVVCTTTLLQGVNLPAQNIFIRNPHLYIKKTNSDAELSNYDMANLRGRAGRLLKDFVGRTFVMDETEFSNTDGYEQLSLFDDVTKELPSGYSQNYEEYKDYVDEVLKNNNSVDDTMSKFGYLISYIRQAVLRYGDASLQRMQNIGIQLTPEQVAAIKLNLEDLSIPKNICYQNRYWDPLILEKLYTEFDGKIPSNPLERGAKANFDKMLKFMRDNDMTSAMYNKYIPKKYRKGSYRGTLVNLCMNWAKEKPLKDILSGSQYLGVNGAENIEETIDLTQRTVSFSIPLLLKPLFDIKNPESSFLSCMQSGAYNIATRTMIELGIARETAIYLNGLLFENEKISNLSRVDIEIFIRNKICENYLSFPYWIQAQLGFLI